MSKAKPTAAMATMSHWVRVRRGGASAGDEDTADSAGRRGEAERLFEQPSGSGLFYDLAAHRPQQAEQFLLLRLADLVLVEGLDEVVDQGVEVVAGDLQPLVG